MPSPPIQVFLTTIASQPALRQRQEYLLRILQVKKIPFTSYDLASDEASKRLWKRKAPLDKQQLPGILVGGKFPGTFSDFEEAVEYGELDQFLRLKETWDEELDDIPKPPVQPIGVPGAMLPLQMTPDHLKTKILASSPQSTPGKKPIPVNKRDDEFDISTELSGYGLQGLMVTEAELADLVADLGLDGDEAGDLVKGLAGGSSEGKEKPGGKIELTVSPPDGVAEKSETSEAKQSEEPKEADAEKKVETTDLAAKPQEVNSSATQKATETSSKD